MNKEVEQILKKYLFFVNDTGNELIFKCPLHPDSFKHPDDPKKGHFYINKDNYNQHCFLCGYSTKDVRNTLLNPKIMNIDNNDKRILIQSILKDNNNKEIEEVQEEVIDDKDQNEQYEEVKNTLIQVHNNTIKHYYPRIFINYISSRGLEFQLIKKLIKKEKLYFIHNENRIKINHYSPSFLLNDDCLAFNYYNEQLPFKLHNYSFICRRVFSKQIPRYLNYKNDIIDKMGNFSTYSIMEYQDRNEVESIFIVEGIFDQLKLYQLLKYDRKSVIIQMNGKNIQRLKEWISYLPMVKNIYIIYDKDVRKIEKLKSVSKLISILNKEVMIYIGNHTKFKDIGEMNDVDDLKTIKFFSWDQFKINQDIIMEKIIKGSEQS